MKPFEGVLTILDTPSDRAPSGARGHRVILKKVAAEAALSSLIGTPINRRWDFASHDKEGVIGTISEAWIDKDNKLRVRGLVLHELIGGKPPRLGMSYEIRDAHIEDMRASVWTITKCTFEGAAVLRQNLAAYRATKFTVKKKGNV